MLELKLMCNIIGVFISIVLLIYIAKLERTKCECSVNWKRTYIKVFAIITIIMSVLMCVRSMLYGKLKVTELKALAKEKGLQNYKSLKKSPLIALLKESD